MVDLRTHYLGFDLPNPLVASSSPLCEEVANIIKMAEYGVAAVVLHSLFEEQITLEQKSLNRFLVQGTESFAESLTYFPALEDYRFAPNEYLKHIERVKKAVHIPVIGSLNGVSLGGWIEYAKKIQDAGADGLELNIYYLPTDPDLTSQKIEDSYVELVRSIKSSIRIPIAVKLVPFLTSMPNFVQRLDAIGVNGLVMFNRFYQPDIDLENMNVTPNLVLSTSDELRLRLRWVAILYEKIKADIAVTGGVHTAQDIVKAIMVGAKIAMMTSALLKYGITHIKEVLNDLESWLKEHNYQSIKEIQGIMKRRAVAEPAAFERANYMKVLQSYKSP